MYPKIKYNQNEERHTPLCTSWHFIYKRHLSLRQGTTLSIIRRALSSAVEQV